MQTLPETRKGVVIVKADIISLSVQKRNQLRRTRRINLKRDQKAKRRTNFVEPRHLLELGMVAYCYKRQERMQLMGRRQSL